MGQPNLKSLNDAAAVYEGGYYQEKLEQGRAFQDYITDILYGLGLVVVTYVSSARGLCGENRAGIEIKKDCRFRDTNNLYIETAEKSNPSKMFYTSSGIYRDDNSWLYLIGDEKTFWIFSKKQLRLLEKHYRAVSIATSKGFVMPLAHADKYSLRKVEP